MSDLHRAVEAEFDAYRPTLLPPFAVIRTRKRRREQRRVGAAVALSVDAVLAAAVGPSALGQILKPSIAPAVIAGPAPSATQDDARFAYGVSWRTEATAYSKEDDLLLQQKCLTLPGVVMGPTLTSLPPIYSGQIIGTSNAGAFRACAGEAAPGANVTVSPLPPTTGPVQFRIRYGDPDKFQDARDTPLVQQCLNVPGVSVPADPYFSRPPTYNVTASGQKADDLRQCLAALGNLSVFETVDPKGAPPVELPAMPDRTGAQTVQAFFAALRTGDLDRAAELVEGQSITREALEELAWLGRAVQVEVGDGPGHSVSVRLVTKEPLRFWPMCRFNLAVTADQQRIIEQTSCALPPDLPQPAEPPAAAPARPSGSTSARAQETPLKGQRMTMRNDTTQAVVAFCADCGEFGTGIAGGGEAVFGNTRTEYVRFEGESGGAPTCIIFGSPTSAEASPAPPITVLVSEAGGCGDRELQ